MPSRRYLRRGDSSKSSSKNKDVKVEINKFDAANISTIPTAKDYLETFDKMLNNVIVICQSEKDRTLHTSLVKMMSYLQHYYTFEEITLEYAKCGTTETEVKETYDVAVRWMSKSAQEEYAIQSLYALLMRFVLKLKASKLEEHKKSMDSRRKASLSAAEKITTALKKLLSTPHQGVEGSVKSFIQCVNKKMPQVQQIDSILTKARELRSELNKLLEGSEEAVGKENWDLTSSLTCELKDLITRLLKGLETKNSSHDMEHKQFASSSLSAAQVSKPVLSRLILEGRYERAFRLTLQGRDEATVLWLCSKVDLPTILATKTPYCLSPQSLLLLFGILGSDITTGTPQKICWMEKVFTAIPLEQKRSSKSRPIFLQVYQNLICYISSETLTYDTYEAYDEGLLPIHALCMHLREHLSC